MSQWLALRKKGAVTPQETELKLSASVEPSPVEGRISRGHHRDAGTGSTCLGISQLEVPLGGCH